MKNINFKTVTEKAKNILLAAFVFGSVGAYFGAHYANQLNTQLNKANTAVTHTAAATAAPSTPTVK